MTEKFQNKYRIASTRLQNWDYRWSGSYFITMCTAGREHYFGEIENGKMKLSNLGTIADIFWHYISARKPFVKLGEYVIMPNHMHGILIIDEPFRIVEALHATPLQYETNKTNKTDTIDTADLTSPPIKNEIMSKKSPKSNSISTIIRSYKSAVTKHANRLGLPNGWQPRFYDHIIRDNAEFERISNYIKNNPVNWQDDKFFNEQQPNS